MVFIDLANNLALLVALSVVSGFIGSQRASRCGTALLQGLVFGSAAVIGMLNPLVLGPGLIFDGRSVAICLCGLFFGPLAAVVAGGMALVCRFLQGGVETPVGVVLVIVISALMGVFFHARWIRNGKEVSLLQLLGLGFFGHLALLLLVFTLPFDKALTTLATVGPPVILVYPLATVLIGRILSDQMARERFIVALRENLEEFRTTLYSIGDAVIGTDIDGRIQHMNPVAEKLTGWPEAEALGKPIDDVFRIISEETRASAKNPVRQILSGEPIQEPALRLRMIARSGRECPIADSAAPIRDAAGKTRGAVLIFRDVTQECAAATALQESEARFRKFMELAPMPLCHATQAGAIDFRNQRFIQVFGYAESDVATVAEWYVRAYPDPHYRQAMTTAWDASVQRAVAENRDIEPVECEITCKNGTLRVAEISGIMLGDGLLVTFMDITDRKRVEDVLRQQTGELQARNDELSRFNRVATDRELRMIEMKQEINELCRQAGQPPRYSMAFIKKT